MKQLKNWKKKMHTQVYCILRKHPALDALQYLIRNRKNTEKCNRMAERTGSVFQCHTFGQENKGKNLYYINFGNARNGFFIHYRWLLKYLCVADRYGFYPVIEWDRTMPYAEEIQINGTDNPFEYYFEQPCNISMEEMKKSYNVFYAEKSHLDDHFLNYEIPDGEKGGYLISDEMMKYLAPVAHKYIRLNQKMQQYMEEQLHFLADQKKTIGVHYRGSDFKSNFNKHPVAVGIEEYIQAVSELMKIGYERVFLATDDAKAIERFQERFGQTLVFYQDVVRTDGEVSVAFSEENREHHKYLLGREVLRDMLTLAECDALVSGMSQVSICAQITKLSYGKEYQDKKVLSKGINSNLNYFI